MSAPAERRHVYRAHGTWGKDGRFGLRAEGTIIGETGMLESPVTVSPALGGATLAPGEMPGGTNPEELLVASAATCLVITLGLALEKFRIPTTALSVQAEGDIERDPAGGFHFTEMRVTSTVLLAEAVDDTTLLRALQLAEERCIISKALRGAMRYVTRLAVMGDDGGQREIELAQ